MIDTRDVDWLRKTVDSYDNYYRNCAGPCVGIDFEQVGICVAKIVLGLAEEVDRLREDIESLGGRIDEHENPN